MSDQSSDNSLREAPLAELESSSSQPLAEATEPPPYQPPSDDVLEYIRTEQLQAEQAGETAAFLTALSGRRNRPRSEARQQGSDHQQSSRHSSDSIDSLLVSDEEEDDQLHFARPHRINSQDSTQRPMEQFEIFDPATDSTPQGPSLASRAGMASQRLAQSVNNKIITPVYRMLDPVAQMINSVSRRFDYIISKFGNPLILKRLLYLFFVFLIIYVCFESGILPGSARDGFGGGYTDRDSLVEFLRNSVRPELIKERMEYLSSMPHQAGTAGDLTLAKYIEEQFVLYGLSPVELSEHDSFISYPNQTAGSTFFELLDGDKVIHTASFVEDEAYAEENGSRQQPNPYHAFSRSQTVEGPVIFANYGTKEDYEFLKSRGVNLDGSIVLVRMGKLELGLKSKIAHAYQIQGMVTFSDYKSESWPAGPGYPDGAFERGSAVVSSFVPGDVLTPGWSSVSGHRIADPAKHPTTANIPIVPASWKDVQPFLDALKGHGVSVGDWSTEKPSVGEWWSGDADSPTVRLGVNIVTKNRHAIWNVFGKLGGVEQGELAVIIGAKRDSFCYGAVESTSGTAVMLELARIFMTMSAKLDWVPLRSIYFASWDGSNHNLAGSTEWVEYNIDELRRNGAVYISLDEAVSGKDFTATGHPMLQKAVESALVEVMHPATNNTMLSHWKEKHIEPFSSPGDYLAFQSYAGIASLELGFRGTAYPKGSCFDTFDWVQKFGDTEDFAYHRAISEVLSILILKLVDDPIVPFDVISYVSYLGWYLNDLKRYAESNSNYKEGVLNFDALKTSIDLLKGAGDKFNSWCNAWSSTVQSSGEPPIFSVHRWSWNTHLISIDKHLLDNIGIPSRTWFKHVIFGPQLWHPWEGDYAWGTYPAVRDQIESQNWKGAQNSIDRISTILTITANKLPI